MTHKNETENIKMNEFENLLLLPEKEYIDSQIIKLNKFIPKMISDFKNKHQDAKKDLLVYMQFKYIRLNIENLFIIEGKIPVDYALDKDGTVGIVNLPDVQKLALFKSIYSDDDSYTITDIIKEIYEKYKNSKKYRYNDIKENYLKDFLTAYIKNFQSIFDRTVLCYDDTINFKKIGTFIDVTLSNKKDSDRHESSQLESVELFTNINDMNCFKYTTIPKFYKERPLSNVDYEELKRTYNEKILSELIESFDKEVINNPELKNRKDEIINQIYEKTKIK